MGLVAYFQQKMPVFQHRTRVWANAQRDGRPASVQRRNVWLTPITTLPCSNTARTRNPFKFTGVPQTRQQISAISTSKFTILRGHVQEVSAFNSYFRLSIHALSRGSMLK